MMGAIWSRGDGWMDRSLAIHREVWRLLLAALVALALIMSLGATSVSAASKGCSVKDKATGRTYSTLQAAAKAARPKATLLVRGTCHGRTVIDKDLTIKGVRNARWGAPVLAAGAPSRPSADRRTGLEVRPTARVTVEAVVIRGGRCLGRTFCTGGAGILNKGRLTLRDVTVRGNGARMKGGGVRNHGTLTLSGRTLIIGNRAAWGGGVFSTGLLIMNDRSGIVGNLAKDLGGHDSGGGGVYATGTVVLNDSSRISGNNVRRGRFEDGAGESGGGGVRGEGKVVLNDASRISGNNGAAYGGGVETDLLVMNDSSVVSGNTAGVASGVWAFSLTMTGSSVIRLNTARRFGGGAYRSSPSQTLTGVRCAPNTPANVYGNTPDDCIVREFYQ